MARSWALKALARGKGAEGGVVGGLSNIVCQRIFEQHVSEPELLLTTTWTLVASHVAPLREMTEGNTLPKAVAVERDETGETMVQLQSRGSATDLSSQSVIKLYAHRLVAHIGFFDPKHFASKESTSLPSIDALEEVAPYNSGTPPKTIASLNDL